MKIKNGIEDEDKKHQKDNFIFIGFPGGGKTWLATTLPGRTFAFAFDPTAARVYELCPWIDYIEYPVNSLELGTFSLTEGKNKKGVSTNAPRPTAYNQYAQDVVELLRQKTLNEYDNIIMDSTTTCLESIMDEVLYLNDRMGRQPHMDDYGPQITTMRQTFRQLCSPDIKARTVFIVHNEYAQDKETKRMEYIPLLTGKLKTQVAIYFNHIFHCVVENGKYQVQTVPNKTFKMARTSFEHLEDVHDVTIPITDINKRQNFGMGEILQQIKG